MYSLESIMMLSLVVAVVAVAAFFCQVSQIALDLIGHQGLNIACAISELPAAMQLLHL
jgi:hypothetical protein